MLLCHDSVFITIAVFVFLHQIYIEQICCVDCIVVIGVKN